MGVMLEVVSLVTSLLLCLGFLTFGCDSWLLLLFSSFSLDFDNDEESDEKLDMDAADDAYDMDEDDVNAEIISVSLIL